jgi:hypothetical protein
LPLWIFYPGPLNHFSHARDAVALEDLTQGLHSATSAMTSAPFFSDRMVVGAGRGLDRVSDAAAEIHLTKNF